MTRAAPRIDRRLLEALERFDRPGRRYAETNRLVGELAERLGLPRPSYEQVRVLVHESHRRPRSPSALSVYLDVAYGLRSPVALAEHVVGIPPPRTRR